jgi:hypothetical protein
MTARRSSFPVRLFFTGVLATAFGLAAFGTAPAEAPSPGPEVQVLGAPAPTPGTAAQDQADPPSRVGRLAQITGTVSFHTSDESQWEAATLNYPITSGNSLWTEPQAHTAIDVGGSRLYLDGSTELDIGTLNDQGFQASLPQGAIYLRAGNDGSFEIDTPRGAVTISQPGHYEIVAGDATHPTTVTALDGTAQIAGPGVNMTVTGPQTASLTGQNPVTGTTGLAQRDDFIAYADNVEQPYLNPAPAQQQAEQQTQQYVSPGMTGAQDLGQYGEWQQTPDYGPAWFPQVAISWAPYRYGHWAYIAPWGWTWIDDASWGFAPFHYGRWAHFHHRWCWVPGGFGDRPVYAPALVSFLGNLLGINLGGGPAVGWIPLGPREVWYPPYRHGPHYFRDVNYWGGGRYGNFNDARNVNIPLRNFLNQRDATLVAASAMANSQPIGRSFHDITPAEWQGKFANVAARSGEVPVKPTLRTAGLTPTTARQFGQVLAANGQLPGRPQAPGPQVAANNRTGITLGNGRSLPNFTAAQPNGAKIQAQNGNTGGNANAGGAGRIITLGNTDEQGSRPGQSFGGFTQRNQMLQGQNQVKPGAPGPAILPRGFTAMPNAATGSSQNGSQRWAFLPPLQKQGQGGNQAGLQANSFNSVWSSKNGQTQQQGQSQAHGQATIIGQNGTGQGLIGQGNGGQGNGGQGNKHQRWASLTPPQQQLPQQPPQAFRNGQQGGAAFTKLAPQQRQISNGQQQQQAGTQRQSFAPQSGNFIFQPQQQQRQPQFKQRSRSAGTGNKPLLPRSQQPSGN